MHNSKVVCLFFRFRPYISHGPHGFKIMYETQDCPDPSNGVNFACSAQCSETYTDRVGNLTHLVNLEESSTRINCAYNIVQKQGNYIRMKDMTLNLPCAIAFLEIRDGPQEDSPLIGRFCGENKNNFVHFSSSQNHVVIRFVCVN